MNLIKGLGYQNLVDYVVSNSTLKKDQFTFAMQGDHGYVDFIVAKNNTFLFLGRFSYTRFIKEEWGTNKRDLIAITRFLDLCIKKLEDEKIEVPVLTGYSGLWDDCYKD